MRSLAPEITRLSTKGQIMLPKAVRDSRAWEPGTEFTIEDKATEFYCGLRVAFPRTTLDQVAGSLRVQGKPKTLAEMDSAIAQEVSRRRDGRRY